jgi:hypothetical protein
LFKNKNYFCSRYFGQKNIPKQRRFIAYIRLPQKKIAGMNLLYATVSLRKPQNDAKAVE